MAKQQLNFSPLRRFFSAVADATRRKNLLETVTGAAIVAFALYFLGWMLATARTARISGYSLKANFASTGGVSRGADVAVNGVKVGSVEELKLDPFDYSVDMTMTIDSRYRFPEDSVAKIAQSGLVGDRRILILPGTSKDFAKNGDRLKTEPYKSLEEIIGDVIFK
jgi:phospholipid/cholesterol/gamma-HCH transport system substrate-binding protein